MINKVFLLIFFSGLIFANEYYSKLEPFETYKVKSSVSGKIIYVNKQIEASNSKNSTIVKIDSKLNEIELNQYRKKLSYINNMIKIENRNYDRLKKVSSKSAFEKDNQKLKVINYESQKSDLVIKIESLKDTIKNKKLVEKSNYIFNIAVNEGDYVNPGTLLYETKDLSKAKLEIYVPISDINTIKEKDIFIDGKKSDVKISKIYDVADSTHISSYKVELVLNNVKKFSRLVKVEFR